MIVALTSLSLLALNVNGHCLMKEGLKQAVYKAGLDDVNQPTSHGVPHAAPNHRGKTFNDTAYNAAVAEASVYVAAAGLYPFDPHWSLSSTGRYH